MARGIEKSVIFPSPDDYSNFLTRLGKTIDETGMTVYAWTLLPNHLHLLARTGSVSLSVFMQKLLTGYAVSFNKKYKRVGRLFQNRFKSILVEEEPYFLELVRYIHLNPLRSGIVKNLAALDSYPWCGHAGILEQKRKPWHDTEYVLSRFGNEFFQSISQYKEFISAGLMQNRKENLNGGGLHRSIGGWEKVTAVVKGREMWASDERILGSSGFVLEILTELEENEVQQPEGNLYRSIEELAQIFTRVFNISEIALKGRTHVKKISDARAIFSHIAVDYFGNTVSSVAAYLNKSKQAISKNRTIGKDLTKCNIHYSKQLQMFVDLFDNVPQE